MLLSQLAVTGLRSAIQGNLSQHPASQCFPIVCLMLTK